MRACVVGGAGFIGSHLCETLLKDSCQVVCVDNLSLGRKQNIQHMFDNKYFTFYEVDASKEKELEQIFKIERPDYVFQLAANSDIQTSAKNPQIEYFNTYTTTFEVLSCMKKYDIKNLFFASTSAVYGDKENVILDEYTSNLSPISYYGAAKLGCEALINAFSYMNNMKALVFRFPNVIGPRLTHGVIYDFINKLNEDSSRLQILGDGKQIKPYIYVEDLIDAIMQFKYVEKPGVMLYNVGAEGETSVDDIAKIVCEEMKLEDVHFCYTGGRCGWNGDVPRFRYSLKKIHDAGWKAKYTSNDAVRMTVRDNIRR